MSTERPASAPDVIPPRKPPEPAVGSDSEGSNATQHEPDLQAEHKERVNPDGKRPRGPYPTGNT